VTADGSVKCGVFADARRSLLESEGVTFLPDGRVDMEACQMSDSSLEEAAGERVKLYVPLTRP
jgi:hypothetical protein